MPEQKRCRRRVEFDNTTAWLNFGGWSWDKAWESSEILCCLAINFFLWRSNERLVHLFRFINSWDARMFANLFSPKTYKAYEEKASVVAIKALFAICSFVPLLGKKLGNWQNFSFVHTGCPLRKLLKFSKIKIFAGFGCLSEEAQVVLSPCRFRSQSSASFNGYCVAAATTTP